MRLGAVHRHGGRHLRVAIVAAEFAGNDPWNASLGGSLDQLRLRVWRGGEGEYDDEHILAFECRNEKVVRLVIALFHIDSRGEAGLGVIARDCSNVELLASK